MAAVVLLLVSAVWFVGRDDGALEQSTPDAAPATTARTEQPPITEPATDPDPTDPDPTAPDRVPMESTGDSQLDAAIDEAARFVEDARGLLFTEPVLVEVLDDDAFVERLREGFEEDSVQDLELIEQLYVALGLLDDDVDLVETFGALLDAGVLGFFDPETAELVVRGTDPTLATRQTIVHELVHALDHQWFDLDRPELSDADDESSFGFSAIVEGSAMVVQNAWTRELSSGDLRALRAEELSFALESDFDPFAFPMILIQLIQAPYEFGEVLAARLIGQGGMERLDEAFADPPTTSEQVMYPDRYLASEEAIEVEPPPADGEILDEGVFGQLVLWLMLDHELPGADARSAADGWGGDWYVAWADGSRTCVRSDFAMDTPADLEELEAALEVWADSRADAVVESVGSDLVRFTSCG